MAKYKAEDFIEAIEAANGIIADAARRLGCSRQTIYNAVDRYVTVAQALEDARAAVIDLAESQLIQQIKKGDTTAIIFTLKTIGRNRGYVERQEVEHTKPVEIVVRYADTLDNED